MRKGNIIRIEDKVYYYNRRPKRDPFYENVNPKHLVEMVVGFSLVASILYGIAFAGMIL